jgi:hypothetical protein
MVRPEDNNLEKSLLKLVNYIETQSHRGYDPYDALKSPLFSLPVLKNNHLIKFSAQQFVTRLPVNIRPLMAIPKGYNPVTLGLCIQGYSYLVQSLVSRASGSNSPLEELALNEVKGGQGDVLSGSEFQLQREKYLGKIHFLINELMKLIPSGFHGACWGYDFDWEARHATIPAYQPNIVATGIITNALYIAYKVTGNIECAELIKSSAGFVLNDLNKTYNGDTFVFSYSPFDNQQVFNASMKGVRLLAQAYDLTNDENLKTEAKRAAEFVVSKQRDDGSWGYSLSSEGGWTDNYHTGYVLDCLHEYSLICQDREFDDQLSSGYKFYKYRFVERNGIPRFYAEQTYPVDCTSASQTIFTLNRFGDNELAHSVAAWMISNMQAGNGGFFYRKFRYFTVKTSFMRWSNAWMFAAMAKMNAVLRK